MDIASVFEWFAQESKSIAEQAAERERREKFAELALLWASAAQQCSGGAHRRVSWSARSSAGLFCGSSVQPTSRLGVEVVGLLCFRRAAGPIGNK